MDSTFLPIERKQFDRLFPFFILLDAELTICDAGRSLLKIVPHCLGKPFVDSFTFLRPGVEAYSLTTFQNLRGQMLVFQATTPHKVLLRGELEYIEASHQILFVGSPWFGSMDQVSALDLHIADFAIHDPMIDLLHVLKTHEIATDDIKKLLQTVSKQKNDLKNDQKELERLSVVAKTNPQGVLFHAANGEVIWSNEGFGNLTGYSPEEAIGKTPVALMRGPLTDHNQMLKMIAQFESKQATELELILYRKDKTWFWANVKLQPIQGVGNGQAEFFAIIEDIHARKLAAEEIQRSASRLSAVIRDMQTGVILESQDRRIALINQEFCDLFGIPATPAQLIGADCADSAEQSKHLFQDGEGFVKRIADILQQKTIVTGELLQLKSGKIYERAYIPIFERDVYQGHLWRYDDVTERETYARKLRLQEEKYRNIIANMNLGLLEVDLQDEVHYANQGFLQISGYTLEEVVGQKAAGMLMEEDAYLEIQNKAALRREGVADMYEVPVRNKQGQLRWWMISGAPNYDDAGNLIGSIGIHLDITAQKIMEQELNLAKAKAEESSRAKEAFLANMSHEIRTPLNAIIGVFREIERAQLSGKISQYLGNAQSAADHLLDIINNILDMSKIEAGEMQLDQNHFSIQELLERTLSIVGVSAERKHIQLSLNVDEALSPAYLGDEMRIRQVLLNLLGNAIKFTSEGSVQVRCSIHQADLRQHILAITVKDTGQGMEPGFLDKIWQKFSQEDGTIARKYGGTGLGMAISHELIQMMGGSIFASSELNVGTTIEILLPLQIGNPSAIVQHTVIVDEDFEDLRGKRILLVEDNPMNRMVAIASLEYFGMEVTEAENGLLAVQEMQTQQFDLILMDVQMPVMDGLAATREIRSFDEKTPIVALSANAFKREVDQCLEAGMNAYVTKPFEEPVLLGIIKELCLNRAKPSDFPPGSAATMEASKVYDLKKIRDIARGNEAFVKQMVDLFLEETPRVMGEMDLALQSSSYEQLRKLAHRIKPSVEAMGMPQLHREVKEIERICIEAPEPEKLRTLLRQAQANLARACEALRADLPK